MRRRKVWALLLATMLVAAGSMVRAGADDDDDFEKPYVPAKQGWFSRWFGKKDKKPAKKPAADKKKAASEHKVDKPADKPTLNDHMAQLRQRAKDNYLRRSEVCIKLRQIAIETQDDELLQQVKVLEKRIWDACSRHLDLKQDLNAFETDEDIIKRKLGDSGGHAEDEQVLIQPMPGLRANPVAVENKR